MSGPLEYVVRLDGAWLASVPGRPDLVSLPPRRAFNVKEAVRQSKDAAEKLAKVDAVVALAPISRAPFPVRIVKRSPEWRRLRRALAAAALRLVSLPMHSPKWLETAATMRTVARHMTALRAAERDLRGGRS